MITRIVKMTFREARAADFQEFVLTIKDRIRNFAGCQHLEILQDIHNRNIFFSYSRWESEDALDNYRSSDFFQGTWTKTKAWFSAKAEAWTVRNR
ncbi:MAG: antibiotic biosynthesis monooxygenase [Candidatus Aminicenantes bacterium]|nr:antibiotic biosynthesis monooxygenase [Candidatus Aminicenantes bacterium]